MLDTISNISSMATLLLFVLYFIGKVLKIKRIKSTLCETYKLEDNIEKEEGILPYFVNLADDIGAYFSVSSPTGFKTVSFYDVEYRSENDEPHKGKLIKTFKDVLPNEKVYAKVNIPDSGEGCYVELEKNDYIKIDFGVADSGCDGSLVKTDYCMKMTFKSWLYYLCS